MKYKLLLLLFFFSFLGNSIVAQGSKKSNKNSVESSSAIVSKTNALIPAPLATAGSACKELSDATVRVFVTASGNSGDIIEWYDSQESTTILRTGSIYSPFISKTTTFYVQSRSGNDLSVRVPVVASVFNAPPNVSLVVSPSTSPICKGVPLTFTATGGGDLFEFSIDNIVVQAMSSNRVYTTSDLSPGQVVKVKTRYGIILDGTVSEAAWGTGAFEDNNISAVLSPNAVDGYLTSVKISGTEDKLFFGLTGKLNANRSALLFLDTKPGGFNLGNYGDEAITNSSANGFNYFNNNPSTFDSYFLPDYCLAISTKDGGLTYFVDIIELQTGTSKKVSLGTASNGSPSANIGVNNGNTGINDLLLGFEIAVLKSQIGYIAGDIKCFGFTMKDDTVSTYSVTNSFLSPERSSILDFGTASINFNLRDPKAVVVSSDAFMPCYKEASLSVVIVEKPTTATVGPNQTNCVLISTSLGGNTPTVGTGKWSFKSGPGTANFSNINSGSSTVTVDLPGTYVFTWTISNGSCDPSMADITIRFDIPPVSPVASNKTECAQTPIQTLTATATVPAGVTVIWYDAPTGGNTVANPTLNTIGTKTYYAEAVSTTSSCTSPSRTAVVLTINAIPAAPASGGNKTECEASPIQTLTATATAPTGFSVKWYNAATAGAVAANPILSAVGNVTYYAEAVNDATGCVSSSRTGVILTINARPLTPVSAGNKTECAQTPIQTLTATATVASGVTVVWYDAATGGNTVANPTLNTIGTKTYYAEAVNTASTCASTTRTAVVLAINATPAAPASGGNKTECEASPIQTLTATATAPTGFSLKWYNAATAGNVVANPILNAVGNITYYAEAVNDATGCVSSSRTAVELTINSRPLTPISGGNKTECAQTPIQTLTAAATVASGVMVVWYDAATGGNTVASPTLNTIGTKMYYAEAVNTATTCASTTRTAVTLTINAIPVAPASGGNKTECEASPIQTLTATATVPTGFSVKWYNAATAGNVVATPILNIVGNITYFAEAVNDATGCVSSSRTAVVLTINARPADPISGGNQTVCTNGSATQTLTATASGSSFTWYTAATGGTVVSNPTQVGVGTSTYYAEATNGFCTSFLRTSVILTIVGVVPNPTASDQTVCSNGSITQTITATATATGNTITWYSAAAGGSIVSSPTQVGVGSSTYYAESSIGNCISAARTRVILTISATPSIPTVISLVQPTCLVPSGTITVNSQANVEYSIGGGYQLSNVFQGVVSGNYTISVRFLNNTSCPVNAASAQRVNAIPPTIQFDLVGACLSEDYVLTANAVANSYDAATVEYIWKDENGIQVGTNSNTLNVSRVIASKTNQVVFPLTYTISIKSSLISGCETTKATVINGIYCNIQKGISPDGNGSNEFLDLSLMDVRNLEIFNRYGLKVYSMPNYKNQWKGQTNKGEELPSATYYYVIQFNNGETKTGWIYLIREK
jgi:gliding motility-associated-like protein